MLKAYYLYFMLNVYHIKGVCGYFHEHDLIKIYNINIMLTYVLTAYYL